MLRLSSYLCAPNRFLSLVDAKNIVCASKRILGIAVSFRKPFARNSSLSSNFKIM